MSLSFGPMQRISVAQFARVLERGRSPAAAAGPALAAIPEAWHLDRAVALAFFAHESGLGRRGVVASHQTRSWGNQRRPTLPDTATGLTHHPFAIYPTWVAGLTDWCALIARRYVGRGLLTVAQATPVYAPSDDGNRPERYAQAVENLVSRWIAEEVSRAAAASGRYRVMVPRGNVRAGPHRRHRVVETVERGTIITIEASVLGEQIGPDPRWLRLGPGRYIHASLAREEAIDATA